MEILANSSDLVHMYRPLLPFFSLLLIRKHPVLKIKLPSPLRPPKPWRPWAPASFSSKDGRLVQKNNSDGSFSKRDLQWFSSQKVLIDAVVNNRSWQLVTLEKSLSEKPGWMPYIRSGLKLKKYASVYPPISHLQAKKCRFLSLPCLFWH